jgi:muconate cycloisomerase
MTIHSLTAFQVPIALKKPIRHASHVRHHNDTLIVRCELTNGCVGWGEGLPRTYVTGESIESVWRHITQTDFAQLADRELTDPAQVVSALDTFRLADVQPDEGIAVRECFGNSVRCAIELALLDAGCRSAGTSLGDFLLTLPEAAAVGEARSDVFYSGAVTSMTPHKQWISAWKMKLFGFHQVKVKVGTDGIDDVDCLRRVRRIVGPHVDLRLDANEAWTCDQVLDKMKPLLPYSPTSLEQPVPHADVAGLAEVRRNLSVPIMLDESLCCLEDGERAIAGEMCDLFNLRLSKCGGAVNCVRLASMAKQHGLGYQLGCQVGETAILSAAGRHFACNIGEIRYVEGSYDRFLVRETLTDENLTFKRRGRAPRLTGPGLGITVTAGRVREIAVRTQDLL